jgi:hypothetical protein
MGHAGIGADEAGEPGEQARQEIEAVPANQRGDGLAGRRYDRGGRIFLAPGSEQDREQAGSTELGGELAIGGRRPELRGAEGSAQMEPDCPAFGSETDALEEDIDLVLSFAIVRQRERRRARS